MNSFGWQLAIWAAGVEHRAPFFLAVMDGETRLGFVNSHFFLHFQNAGAAEQTLLRMVVHEQDRPRFDHAVAACLDEEKDIVVSVRMGDRQKDWVKWELRFLERASDGSCRIFCMGYALSEEEANQTAAVIGGGQGAARPAGQVQEKKAPFTRDRELMQRMVREAMIKGEQQERDRIGHELHDNINQILASAQLFLSCLQKDSTDFETIRMKTAEMLAAAIKEIRCLSHNIVASEFQEKGLIESVAQLTDDIRMAKHLAIGFNYSDPMTIESQDYDLKLTVYRMIQEQMQNIYKYSRASSIQITLTASNGQLRLSIADNGVGFDPQTVKKGIGIDGIIRRAKLFQGNAMFDTAPGRGCTMIVHIPLDLRNIH